MSTNGSITREELTAFCVRHKDYGVPTADAIWDDIQAHREPEYEPDEVYVSALNVKYYRQAQYEDGRVWLDIQSGEEVRHGVPARPLRKLTPEGSQDAEITKLQNACKLMGRSITGLSRAMEAARIELAQGSAEKAMEWILNSLPDVSDDDPEDQWNGTETANEWFDRTREGA